MDTITYNLTPNDVEYIIKLIRDDVSKTMVLSAKYSMPEYMEEALLVGVDKHRRLGDNFQLGLDMYKINREVR